MARAARPPVIAVMGHIDHGKSSLLDYIRKSNVTAGEAGGITQHVAAYVAEHNDRKVTFLDTPGHEAFKALRARGASAADIAILVVAADEGVMPQTLDALNAIREAKIPFLVAITKIDKNNADPERAKTSLLEHEVFLEGLGGDIPYAEVSSKTGQGVPELLDLVLLAADLAELTGDAALPASGFVLESSMDSKRGAAATLILKDGSLATGSFVVAGDSFAPVRFIEDFLGKRVEQVGPSEPARISGFSKLPPAGMPFSLAKTKKEAEAAADSYVAAARTETAAATDGVAELALVIKADVAGSVDALIHELGKLTHERARIRIISSGVGTVSEGDVKLAASAGGVIIAFNVGTESIARDLADREGVTIESYSIIYELSENVSKRLIAKAPSITVERETGRAMVLKTFSSSAKTQVLGMRLVSGTFAVGNPIKVLRKEEVVARGEIGNLQQARANVKEIRTDGEFGMELEAKHDAAYGDILVAYVTEKT